MDHPSTTIVYIGIGSNIGDRLRYCQQAVAALRDHPNIKLFRVSSLYETAPVDYEAQDSFLNAVVMVETSLSAQDLLRSCQKIEARLDKNITIPKGPRTIDLDLLFYGSERIATTTLVIPHPEINHRLFVLVPLVELSPEYLHPQTNKTMQSLLSSFEADKKQDIVKYLESGWEQPSKASFLQ